jgi:hypothetical protein
MTTSHSLVTLNNTTAINLTDGYDFGFDITIQNLDNAAFVYIGGSDVSSSSFGYKLNPGNAFSVSLSGEDDLYAISSSSSQIAVLKLTLVGKK